MISEQLSASIARYVHERVPTGGFLHAVLANDLYDAAARADTDNRRNLGEIALFVLHNVPDHARGSHEKVRAHLSVKMNAQNVVVIECPEGYTAEYRSTLSKWELKGPGGGHGGMYNSFKDALTSARQLEGLEP